MLDSRLIIIGEVGLTRHSAETVSRSVSCDSPKDKGKFERLSPGSRSLSTSDVATDSQTLAHSGAGDPDSTSCQTVAESSCALLSSSDVLCYGNVEESTNIDEHIVDFLLSLFWVLESKRLDRSCEHIDNLTLLTAPFEQRKDSSTADLDGRLLNFLRIHVHDMMQRFGWLHGTEVRTLVFSRRTFHVLRSTCS